MQNKLGFFALTISSINHIWKLHTICIWNKHWFHKKMRRFLIGVNYYWQRILGKDWRANFNVSPCIFQFNNWRI